MAEHDRLSERSTPALEQKTCCALMEEPSDLLGELLWMPPTSGRVCTSHRSSARREHLVRNRHKRHDPGPQEAPAATKTPGGTAPGRGLMHDRFYAGRMPAIATAFASNAHLT